MPSIQKLPKRTAKKKHTGLAIVLLLLALLLIIGGILSFRAAVIEPQQQLINVMRTRQAEAGQTAVRAFDLTQQAN